MEDELSNLVSWMRAREIRISTYIPAKRIEHPVIREIEVINNIIEAIKLGDLNAIELGCELIVENKRIPFGKTIKSNLLRALKGQVGFINALFKKRLTETLVTWLNLDYPPRESRELSKLVKKFNEKYSQNVIDRVNSENEEARKWVQYLRN